MMMGEKAEGGSCHSSGASPQHHLPGATQAAATPLSRIAEAFEEMAGLLRSDKGGGVELRLDKFCDACSLVSVLFGCLGLAFKFAEIKYIAKKMARCNSTKTHVKHSIGRFKSSLDMDGTKTHTALFNFYLPRCPR